MFTYAFATPREAAPVVTEVVSIKSYDLAESPPAIRISVVKTQTWAQCRIFMQGFTHTGVQGLGSTLGTLENVMPVVEVHPRWTKGSSSLFPGVSWFHATCRMPAVEKPAHKQWDNIAAKLFCTWPASLQPQRCFHHALRATALLTKCQGTWIVYSHKLSSLSPNYDCNLFFFSICRDYCNCIENLYLRCAYLSFDDLCIGWAASPLITSARFFSKSFKATLIKCIETESTWGVSCKPSDWI